jgi:MoaA/NifB/PqqE/SkfB family radical SAM enzyme
MEQLSEVFFSKAFQLVVGCGAEPTMNKNFMHLFRLAKQSKIPNISIVTNGALLSESHISEMVELGVHEIIVSAHGLTKNNYERFMVNGKYEDFISLLQTIQRVKIEKNTNKPEVRINYTANEINLKDLKVFSDFSRLYSFQTLQVRPVMDIGGAYTKKLNRENEKLYNEIINELKKECTLRNIKLLANTADIGYSNRNNKDSYIIESVYTYLSPETKRQYKSVFAKGSLFQYKRVTKWYSLIIKGMFGRHNSSSDTDNFLKYDIL